MMLVLFALFFRPLGFDYRSKIDSKRWRNNWDWGLFAGSAIPAILRCSVLSRRALRARAVVLSCRCAKPAHGHRRFVACSQEFK